MTTGSRRPRRGLGAAAGLAFALGLAAGWADAGDGYWRVAKERGVWWLVSPQGTPTLLKGVADVGPGVALNAYDPSAPVYCALRSYPSLDKWRSAALGRLKDWGFNALGAGAEDALTATHALPWIRVLHLGTGIGVPFADASSPAAQTKLAELAAPCLATSRDASLVGYALDGPLDWWDESVFLRVLRQPAAKDALKARMVAMLAEEYRGDVRKLNEDFDLVPVPVAFDDVKGAFKRAAFQPGRRPLLVERFLEWDADAFYRAATAAVRRVDPNHLIFSDRFAGYYPQPVVRAAGRSVDVIATTYDSFAPQGWAAPFYFDALSALAGKPVLVAETYFAAADNRSGDQNRNGGFMTVATQADRAEGARRLVGSLFRFRGVVGYDWFRWADEPAAGENGAEDFNMGLVDLKDAPYEELAGALAKANAGADAGHGTWPEGQGLKRLPEGLRLPALAELPIVNGFLDEWPLDRAWVDGVAAVAPFERFGDVFLAWHPEGMAVAVVYLDYRATPRAPDGPEADTERLTVGLGPENERPVVFTLKGLQEQGPDGKFRTPEVVAVRGGVPFPAEGRFLIAQSAHGLQRTVELFLPAALFKREKLEAGLGLRATVSLRLRANCRELFWPKPFKATAYDASGSWTPLVLEPAAAPDTGQGSGG